MGLTQAHGGCCNLSLSSSLVSLPSSRSLHTAFVKGCRSTGSQAGGKVPESSSQSPLPLRNCSLMEENNRLYKAYQPSCLKLQLILFGISAFLLLIQNTMPGPNGALVNPEGCSVATGSGRRSPFHESDPSSGFFRREREGKQRQLREGGGGDKSRGSVWNTGLPGSTTRRKSAETPHLSLSSCPAPGPDGLFFYHVSFQALGHHLSHFPSLAACISQLTPPLTEAF